MKLVDQSNAKNRLWVSTLVVWVGAFNTILTPATPALATQTAAPIASNHWAIPDTPTDAPTILVNNSVSNFVLKDGMLFWSSYAGPDCPGFEFSPTCAIRSKPASGGVQRTLFVNGSGPYLSNYNMAVDNTHVYFASQTTTPERVLRVPRNAASSTTVETVADSALVTATIDTVAVDNSYVYWSENYYTSTVGASRGHLFRLPKAGGPREEMAFYNANITQIKADNAGGVFFMAPVFSNLVGHSKPAAGSGFTNEFASVANAYGYTFDATTLYISGKFSTRTRIYTVPLNNLTATPAQMYESDTGDPSIREIAVDGSNLYWHEFRFPSGGMLLRKPLSGGSAVTIQDPLLDVSFLHTDGRFLYWASISSGVINRLPTTASAITRDLTANAATMEVIQAIQSPANDVPLVSGKETFVRVYGRILASSTGETRLNPFPLVQLTGTRGGNPLPESPLSPVNFLPISNSVADRTLLDNWLFRLPASWADGSVTLRAEVNPRHVLGETNFANNIAQTTVNFNRKQTLCLDMVPVQTTVGTIGGYSSAYDAHFARAASMSAVPGYRTVWHGGPPHRRPRIPFGLFGSDPYDLNSDFELNYLMFNLWGDFLFSSDPGDCNGLRTIRTAAVTSASRYGISSGAGSIIAFLIDNGGSEVNRPDGGTKGLVHELGHQHGRAHVNCGGPDGIDGSYPYPGCQIDNAGPNAHIGLDPISRRLLLPTTTADYMSYGPDPLWTSDYTFRAVFNNLRNATLLTSVARPDSDTLRGTSRGVERVAAGEKLMVSGMITGTGPNSALLGYANLLSAAAVAEARLHLNDSAATSAEFTLQALDAAGGLLSSVPLSTTTTHLHSAGEIILFTGFVDPNPAIARIQIINASNVPVGVRQAGAATPIISITSPTSGSTIGDRMNVSWSANDADGDALLFTLRYSNDNGATWRVLGSPISDNSLSVNMTEGLPGGTQALLQVVASDGVHSSSATVGPFVVQRHAPVAAILDDLYSPLNASITTAATQRDAVVLRGSAQDAEDGPLTGSALTWQLTGPITRTGDGEQLTLIGLPPGTYAVQLSAKDSDNATGVATTTLTISPKRVFDSSAAIAVDGLCDEAAYNDELDPVTLRYADETQAGVRFAHANNALYACFEGMPVGAMVNSFVGLRLDLNNSADAKPQSNDRGFFIGRDGVASSATGNGVDLIPDALPDGVTGAVSQNDEGTSWSAELRIDESKLGGWNKLIRMKVGHYWRNFGGDDTNWPNPSVYDIPSTWGLAALGPLTQTITFGTLPNRGLGDSPLTVSASASSGLPISFSTLTPSVCKINGATVTLLGAGTCTLRAAQAGNPSYGAATSVDRSFVVSTNRPVYLPLLSR